MYITQIEVSQMQNASGQGRVSGFVSIDSDEGHVQMHCAVSDTAPSMRRDALIAEALRQLRRMPEFRTGRRDLSFAPGIMVIDPAKA